jgi:hypothetical protein
MTLWVWELGQKNDEQIHRDTRLPPLQEESWAKTGLYKKAPAFFTTKKQSYKII